MLRRSVSVQQQEELWHHCGITVVLCSFVCTDFCPLSNSSVWPDLCSHFVGYSLFCFFFFVSPSAVKAFRFVWFRPFFPVAGFTSGFGPSAEGFFPFLISAVHKIPNERSPCWHLLCFFLFFTSPNKRNIVTPVKIRFLLGTFGRL